MRMDDVETIRARHLYEAVGQREQILRLAKQRIAGRLDAVEPDVTIRLAQSKRRIAADHVGAMSATGEGSGQLRRHHAAAADRRITRNPDVHFSRCSRIISSRTTTPSANATPISAPNCASRLSISC